jgi:hypothetical protein
VRSIVWESLRSGGSPAKVVTLPRPTKGRLRGELDYEVNRRAESEIQGLARKLNLVDEKMDDMADLLRRKN